LLTRGITVLTIASVSSLKERGRVRVSIRCLGLCY
jgi:hypothetical protein